MVKYILPLVLCLWATSAMAFPPWFIEASRGVVASETKIVFTDDFNRADGDMGAEWTTATVKPTISSNKLLATSNISAKAILVSPFPANQKVCVDVGSRAAATGGVFARTSGALTTYYWFGFVQAENSVELAKQISGTWTTLNTSTSSAVGRYCLSVDGSSLVATIDGSVIYSRTDSAISSGQPGLNINRAAVGTTLDNFSAEEL